MQTTDQRYAAKAYQQVCEIKKQDGYTKYGAMAHKLPFLIHTAGLTQALAFVDTRDSPIQRRLLADLQSTIELDHAKDLLDYVREANLREYMRLTRQVLAALLWYKRFAQSILNVDASEASLENGEDYA